MTKILCTTAVATVLLCWIGVGVAHDASLHRGTPLDGRIVAVTSTTITIATASGSSVDVAVSDETTVNTEAGPATQGTLTAGQHITVHGPKLPGGSVAAKEIMVHTHPGSHEPNDANH